MEVQRSHSMKLWSWSLIALETPKCWRCQSILASSVEYLLRRAAYREWNQPNRHKCVAVNIAERSWRSEEHFDIRLGKAEFRVCPAGFWSYFSPVFLHYAPFFPFEMMMYILCQYMLELCDLLFYFDFMGVTVKRVSEETLNFGILNIVETVIDYGDFWSWTECFLHYDMPVSL